MNYKEKSNSSSAVAAIYLFTVRQLKVMGHLNTTVCFRQICCRLSTQVPPPQLYYRNIQWRHDAQRMLSQLLTHTAIPVICKCVDPLALLRQSYDDLLPHAVLLFIDLLAQETQHCQGDTLACVLPIHKPFQSTERPGLILNASVTKQKNHCCCVSFRSANIAGQSRQEEKHACLCHSFSSLSLSLPVCLYCAEAGWLPESPGI